MISLSPGYESGNHCFNLLCLMVVTILPVTQDALNEFLKCGSEILNKQDRQWTYNVTFRRVRETFVAWKSNEYYIFWVCVCSLSYLACKAHVPYYIFMCSLSISYNITLSPKWHDFRKKVLNKKCIICFSLQSLSEKFFNLRRIQRDTIINVHRSSCKVHVILVRF
jgi:hypothetical protein